LVPERVLALDKDLTPIVSMVVKWSQYRISLDGSAAIANGIYLQMEREFGGQEAFDAVKQAIFNDQMGIFDLLGVKEDVGA